MTAMLCLYFVLKIESCIKTNRCVKFQYRTRILSPDILVLIPKISTFIGRKCLCTTLGLPHRDNAGDIIFIPNFIKY
jgi:hypothetical protein